MVLSFAKPERAVPVPEWKSNQADGAPPGTYVPNMSKEDKLKWKATLVGVKSGDHQIEIRSCKPWSNVLMVVNGTMPHSDHGNMRFSNRPHEVKISTNGPMHLSPEVWAEMSRAVEEAHGILRLLDTTSHLDEAIARIRSGKHPLGD